MVNGHKYCPPLTKDIKCDVLIVGGGFSGVSAAAEFLRKGLSVVLIEKNIVGGSSSGRSAGFLTPDSELELHQLVRRYGTKAAAEIWEAPCRGIERIVEHHQEARHPMRIAAAGFAVSRARRGRQGGRRVRARVPRKRRLHRSAHLRREQLQGDPRRAGLHGGHPVRRHLRRQSAAVPAGPQGPADRQRHAGLREHRDGTARGPHGLYACRQRDRGQHHHRGRQADQLDQSARRRDVPRADVPERDRAADRQGAAHPVSVRRADAVLGLEARVFVLQADGGQPSAARAAARPITTFLKDAYNNPGVIRQGDQGLPRVISPS